MPVLRYLLRIADRPHLPRRTIRLRLTALYGGTCHTESKGSVVCTIPGHYGRKGFLTISGFSSGHRAKGSVWRQVHALSQLANSQSATDLHNLLVYSWLALAIMAVLSVALGWLVAGRVLRAVRVITTTARNISATNLHERLALGGPDDELKELGNTFAALLARPCSGRSSSSR